MRSLLIIFAQKIIFWKEHLAHTLLISLRICSISVPLFTYNPYSIKLMLLLVKKPDSHFVSSCAKHRAVLLLLLLVLYLMLMIPIFTSQLMFELHPLVCEILYVRSKRNV